MSEYAVEEALEMAMGFHRTGQYASAEQIYRQVLSAVPNHPDALHLLGVLATQAGNHLHAIEYFSLAIAHAKKHAAAHNSLGIVYAGLGRYDEALTEHESAIQHAPDTAEFHNSYAVTLQHIGRYDDAIDEFHKALEINPNYVEGLNNLGVALQKQGDIPGAIGLYRRALTIRHDFVPAWHNLGSTLREAGDFEAAVDAFRRAIELEPSLANAHIDLGNALCELGRAGEALISIQQAIRLCSTNASYQYNLGNVLKSLCRYEEAMVAYRKAIDIDPKYAEAYNNLGAAHRELGNIEEAIGCFQSALSIQTDNTKALRNLGSTLSEREQFDEATVCFERLLRLCPDSSSAAAALLHQQQKVCYWDAEESLMKRISPALDDDAACEPADLISPFVALCLPHGTTAEQQFRVGKKWIRGTIVSRLSSPPCDARPIDVETRDDQRALPGAKLRDRVPIRIGFISGDFRSHPVGYLIPELIESIDRSRFAVYGYSFGKEDSSNVRSRLFRAFDYIREIDRKSHVEAADVIQEDAIDILVDLQGHTLNARPNILSLRPARIQVTYLGFAATTGADFIDYILVDSFVVPPEEQLWFSEKLFHLPGCFMVNDSHRKIDLRTPSRQELGLPEGSIVFCGFSSPYKITRKMFECWCRILQRVASSVLWLRDIHSTANENLIREAVRQGIDSRRLIFAPRTTNSYHLSRQRAADLFLDTFPYNQHSTAADGLRTGLPIVTCVGSTFASRVAGSLLNSLGLCDLVTDSLDAYESLAVRLAKSPNDLAAVRKRLADQLTSSDVFDGKAFARKIEKAFDVMLKKQPSKNRRQE